MRAPAAALVELRTMTPVIGRPPSRPETVLPAPWPTSSRSRFDVVPGRSLSTATADSRLSIEAMIATVTTPTITPPRSEVGSTGSAIASRTDPPTSTRSTGSASTAATTVSSVTASSGAGMPLTQAGTLRGSRGQASRIPTTATPSVAAGPCVEISWPGRATMFAIASSCCSPPSTTWS